MAIKQVTCSICKATINKARTYHVGDGQRACKAHDGVQEKKAALETHKQDKASTEHQRDRHRYSTPARGAWSGDHGLKCWVCMNPGIRQDEYAMKVLIEMEKIKKIHGIVNPLDPKYRVRLAERCIFVISSDKVEPAMKYIRDDFKDIVALGNHAAICGPCCHLVNIDPTPPLSMDQLVRSSFMYVAFMEPVLSAEAGRQLARDN